MHFDVRFERGDRDHQTKHVRGAGHVVLHLAHALRGLDADAAGIERDAFADEHVTTFALLRRHVRNVNEPFAMRAPAPDGVEQMHSAFLDFFFVEDRDLELVIFRDARRVVRHRLREHHVRRFVRKIACRVHAERDALAERNRALRIRRKTALGGDRRFVERLFRFAVARQIFREAIRAEIETFGDETQSIFETIRKRENERLCFFAVRDARCLRRKRAHFTRAGFVAIAEPEEHELLRGKSTERRHRQRLIFFSAELFFRDEAAHAAAERAIERIDEGNARRHRRVVFPFLLFLVGLRRGESPGAQHHDVRVQIQRLC